MLNTHRAVIRNGKIELLERADLPEGATVLLTILPEADAPFWSQVGQVAMDAVWSNTEDHVYRGLLEA